MVAAGVAVPAESRLLYCHHDPAGDGGRLEVYEVPDDFYVRHTFAAAPRDGRRLADVPRVVSPLTEEMIRARHAAAAS